jgi:hypothetical protein
VNTLFAIDKGVDRSKWTAASDGPMGGKLRERSEHHLRRTGKREDIQAEGSSVTLTMQIQGQSQGGREKGIRHGLLLSVRSG